MPQDVADRHQPEQEPAPLEPVPSRNGVFRRLIQSMSKGRNERVPAIADVGESVASERTPEDVEREVAQIDSLGRSEQFLRKEIIKKLHQELGFYDDAGIAVQRFNFVSIPGPEGTAIHDPRQVKELTQETDPRKLAELSHETQEAIYAYRRVEQTIATADVLDLEKFDSLEVSIDQEYPENALIEKHQLIGAREQPLLSLTFSFREYLRAVADACDLPEQNVNQCFAAIEENIGLVDLPMVVSFPLNLTKEEWQEARQNPQAYYQQHAADFKRQFAEAGTVITDVLGWTSTLEMHRKLDERGIDNARRSLSQIPTQKWDQGRVFIGFATGEMQWSANRDTHHGGAGTFDVAVATQTCLSLLGLYQKSPLLLDSDGQPAHPGQEELYRLLPQRELIANGHSMGAGQALQGDGAFDRALGEVTTSQQRVINGESVPIEPRITKISSTLRNPAVNTEEGSTHFWADVQAVLRSSESSATKVAAVTAAFLTSTGADFFDTVAAGLGEKLNKAGGKKLYQMYKHHIEAGVAVVLTDKWFLRGAGSGGDELFNLLKAHAQQFQMDVRRATVNAIGSAEDVQVTRSELAKTVTDPNFPINEMIITTEGDRMANAAQLLQSAPDSRALVISSGGHHHTWAGEDYQVKLNMTEQFAKLPRELFRFAHQELLNEWYQQQQVDPPIPLEQFLRDTLSRYAATLATLCGLTPDMARSYFDWRATLHTQLREGTLDTKNHTALVRFLFAVQERMGKGRDLREVSDAFTTLQKQEHIATLYPDLLVQMSPIGLSGSATELEQQEYRAMILPGLSALETLIEFLEVNGSDIRYNRSS